MIANVLQTPCEKCQKHGQSCLYRPAKSGKTWKASVCMSCYFGNGKCSAAGGEVRLQKEIDWVYDSAAVKAGTAQIAVPSLSVRKAFITKLIKEGKMSAWPEWLDSDGACIVRGDGRLIN